MVSIDVLGGLVIRMKHKWLRFKVMTPMCQGSDYGIELFVISAIITLRPVEFLTEIGNRPPRLDQDNSNPNSSSITLHLEQALKDR